VGGRSGKQDRAKKAEAAAASQCAIMASRIK